jgi:hypothetical protein
MQYSSGDAVLFSRRSALASGLAAAVLAQARVAAADETAALCRASLATLFPNSLNAARALGHLCRENGQTAETLLLQLCETPEERWRLACAPTDEIRATIEAKIRADYVSGRVRRIDGWVLSRTETWIFALLAA